MKRILHNHVRSTQYAKGVKQDSTQQSLAEWYMTVLAFLLVHYFRGLPSSLERQQNMDLV
jgi:hypothetical protein